MYSTQWYTIIIRKEQKREKDKKAWSFTFTPHHTTGTTSHYTHNSTSHRTLTLHVYTILHPLQYLICIITFYRTTVVLQENICSIAHRRFRDVSFFLSLSMTRHKLCRVVLCYVTSTYFDA